MSELSISLSGLGWSHFFQQQLSVDEWEATVPVRVLAIHRNHNNFILYQVRTMASWTHLQAFFKRKNSHKIRNYL